MLNDGFFIIVSANVSGPTKGPSYKLCGLGTIPPRILHLIG